MERYPLGSARGSLPLCRGISFPVRQAAGSLACMAILEVKTVRCLAIGSPPAFKTSGGILSGPDALPRLSLCSCCWTSARVGIAPRSKSQEGMPKLDGKPRRNSDRATMYPASTSANYFSQSCCCCAKEVTGPPSV